MDPTPLSPGATALVRTKPSRLVHFVRALVRPGTRLLDFGCGYGGDVQALREAGYQASGYDPYHPPYDIHPPPTVTWPLVTVAYVLGFLPPTERAAALVDLWGLLHPDGAVMLLEREARDVRREAERRAWEPYQDGWIALDGAFRRGFTAQDIYEQMAALGLAGFGLSNTPNVFVFAREGSPVIAGPRPADGCLALPT